MTIHYHGTPITPRSVLQSLAGKHFCVSYARPEDVETAHRIGQSVMLDNGAFSFWRSGSIPDWSGYYEWCQRWLEFPTTWAVIPDVIEGSEFENDRLIAEWSVEMGGFHRSAPVWHIHESLDRLARLSIGFERVCFGSSGQYAAIGTGRWHGRIIEAFNYLHSLDRPLPWVHMLRGMSLAGSAYPFSSVDSTDVARNHNRKGNDARAMADRWDSLQCPAVWNFTPEQIGMEEITA